MKQTMRRKDRAMDELTAWDLLKTGEYGVLSTSDDKGQPYGVPLSYVLVDGALYMHSAVEGHKLSNIKANSKVAFCVVGDTELLAGKFSTRYQSVIVFGSASVLEEKDKKAPLVALIEKYFPDEMVAGEKYINKMIHQTAVIKVAIDYISGKTRQ